MIETAAAAVSSVNLGLIAVGFAVLVLAGVVKGVIGMGLPTVGIGLLSVFLAPPDAAALLILPATVTNFWQYFTGPNILPIARRFFWMMVMVAAGTLVGGLLLGGLASAAAQPVLGATLLAYGALGLSSVQLKVPERHEPWLSPLVGFLTGLVTGTTGVSVMPSAPYLQSLGLARDDLVQALGLTFIVSTTALADPAAALASAAALLPAFIGMQLGAMVRRAASPQMFRRIFFSGLGLLGVYMLARGLI